MVMMKRDLGELLVEKRVISPEQLQKARQVQQTTRQSDLAPVLIDLGFIDETTALKAKAAAQGLSFVDLGSFSVDSSAVNIVGFSGARNDRKSWRLKDLRGWPFSPRIKTVKTVENGGKRCGLP